MERYSLKLLPFLFGFILIFRCSKEISENGTVNFTLDVSAEEGGTVSNQGGTFTQGTTITIAAVPNDGYEFVGWEGSNEIENEITVLINSNIKLRALFIEVNILGEIFGDQKIEQVYKSLKILSEDWIQNEVNLTNEFFNEFSFVDTKYWVKLFNDFFEENKLTSSLWNYLQYPMFYWLGDEVNYKLQNSVLMSLQKRLTSIQQINFDTKEEVFSSLKAFGAFIKFSFNNSKEDHYIYRIAENYSKILINSHGVIFNFHHELNESEVNLFGDIKAQLYYILSSLSYIDYELYSGFIDLIKIDSESIEHEIFLDHRVLVYHNNFFSSKTLNLVNEVFQYVPAEYHNVVGFTHSGCITNPHVFQSIGGFNVFGINTNENNATNAENGFPNEVARFDSDLFYIVFVHELNHNVDAIKINTDNELVFHKNLLIENAGQNQKNYLRSVVDDSYFVENPQEFIASISNMYFTNSFKTFEVALKRAETGNFNPMDQFLFIARLYGSESYINFFNYGTTGPLFVDQIICNKNDDGYINSINIDGVEYNFTLDQNNLVTDINLTL